MTTWEQDKAWSDRFLSEIKRHVAEVVISEAPFVEDAKHNTDLLVLTAGSDSRTACRIRKHRYRERYGNEFTIRTNRPSGARTELDKLVEGWGNYIFYGFSCPEGRELAQWFIGDLNVFRRWIFDYLVNYKGKVPGWKQNNPDGSSSFRAFALRSLPDEFIVASHALPKPIEIANAPPF